MTSLVFRVLDTHVIGGLADNIAIEDGRGTMSYAQLLHESASIAGALTHVGVEQGSRIVIELPSGRDRVVAVLACARIGAVPADEGDFRIFGTPPVLHTPTTEVKWSLLVQAGRTEPAGAPDMDADGYEELLLATHGDIFATLAAGGTIS